MRELSLFSGAGGGLLATKHLLGWETVGYVEIEPYCQMVLSKRIEEGYLPKAPIFTDIRIFARRYARRFKGLVDIITAGFPCQPFSVAGRGKAERDDRNMWPQTIKVIRIIRPAFVFLENVPGILAHEYALTIFDQLAENGYAALPPLKLGANDIGSPHVRKRIWIVAFSICNRLQGQEWSWMSGPKGRKHKQAIRSNWWCAEPDIQRVANGVPNRVDRLKAIGNKQVPAVVRAAWELLTS